MSNSLDNDPILLGITGASGSIYALRLAEILKELKVPVHGVISEAGDQVLKFEKCQKLVKIFDKVFSVNDFFAPPASGSARYRAMVIIPCSMGTLGKVNAGLGDNLLTRAADVFIKENRKLIVLPREMPFSTIHLRNMLELSKMGVTILPASPGFYFHPESVQDLVDTVVSRVLDHLHIEHSITKRWREKAKSESSDIPKDWPGM